MAENPLKNRSVWIEILRIVVAAITAIIAALSATGCSSMGDVQWNGRLLRHPETEYKTDLGKAAESAITPPVAPTPSPKAD